MTFRIDENGNGEVEVGLIGNEAEIDAETALAWAAVTQVEVLRQIRDELSELRSHVGNISKDTTDIYTAVS